MKKNILKYLIGAISACALITGITLHAQSKKELKQKQQKLLEELRMTYMREANIPREHPEALEDDTYGSSDSPAVHQWNELREKEVKLWKEIHKLQKEIDKKEYPPQVFEPSQFLQTTSSPEGPPQ